jgi:hypothetical protein
MPTRNQLIKVGPCGRRGWLSVARPVPTDEPGRDLDVPQRLDDPLRFGMVPDNADGGLHGMFSLSGTREMVEQAGCHATLGTAPPNVGECLL